MDYLSHYLGRLTTNQITCQSCKNTNVTLTVVLLKRPPITANDPIFFIKNIFILKNGDVSKKLELNILRKVMVISSLKNEILKVFQKISWPTKIALSRPIFQDIDPIFF